MSALGRGLTQWVHGVLADQFPGVEVAAVEVGEVIGGTAGKMRLLLSYNDPARSQPLPATVVVKGDLGHHTLAPHLREAYRRETRFYREWAPMLEINMPGCFGAESGLLVLEDLADRNVEFGRAGQPMSADRVARVLDLLASLHARWWASPDLDRLEAFPGGLSLAFTLVLDPSHWEACLTRPAARTIPADFLDRDRLERALRASWTLGAAERPRCLIHGDPHLGNLYFETDGRPGLVDWQFFMAGPWAHDVQFAIVTSLDIGDRQKHEGDLLAHYLDRLAGHGIDPPSLDEAWTAYRRSLVYGLLWIANPEECQPDEVNTANVQRFAAAVSDHDVFELLVVA